MQFGEAVLTAYVWGLNFWGRASRAEFWWFYLFYFPFFALGVAIEAGVFGDWPLRSLATFFIFLFFGLPQISISVRRLHDTGRSGLWYFLFLIPFVGLVVKLVMCAAKGEDKPNAYGPPPLEDVNYRMSLQPKPGL
jgi:uncharacterized membrane protein YhaH (DUF805 family)